MKKHLERKKLEALRADWQRDRALLLEEWEVREFEGMARSEAMTEARALWTAAQQAEERVEALLYHSVNYWNASWKYWEIIVIFSEILENYSHIFLWNWADVNFLINFGISLLEETGISEI